MNHQTTMIIGVLAAAVVAGGCSTDEHGPADAAFAQGMIPHHTQAVTMSEQASTRAFSPQVKALAARIRGEQGPEIEQMKGMLAAWGAPAGRMDAGAMPGMGMMSDQDMRRLDTLSGASFDRAFLQMMTTHHQGAIDMAHTEQAQGRDPQATALAGSIITGQQREIDEMAALLRQG